MKLKVEIDTQDIKAMEDALERYGWKRKQLSSFKNLIEQYLSEKVNSVDIFLSVLKDAGWKLSTMFRDLRVRMKLERMEELKWVRERIRNEVKRIV